MKRLSTIVVVPIMCLAKRPCLPQGPEPFKCSECSEDPDNREWQYGTAVLRHRRVILLALCSIPRASSTIHHPNPSLEGQREEHEIESFE